MTRPSSTHRRKQASTRRSQQSINGDAMNIPRSVATRCHPAPFHRCSVSCALLWAALPPLNWAPLAWIAPVFWLRLIRTETLSARRPYWAIWAASVVFWIVTMQGIRLAHWANYFGLVAMSCYLGIYLPLFVGITRAGSSSLESPPFAAAPVAWVGLELLRAYGPLGFSMALLAHTQSQQLTMIQISDLCGAYTVSFLIMLVAALTKQSVESTSPNLDLDALDPRCPCVAGRCCVRALSSAHRLSRRPSNNSGACRPDPRLD